MIKELQRSSLMNSFFFFFCQYQNRTFLQRIAHFSHQNQAFSYQNQAFFNQKRLKNPKFRLKTPPKSRLHEHRGARLGKHGPARVTLAGVLATRRVTVFFFGGKFTKNDGF
jgi:hypothetical protein